MPKHRIISRPSPWSPLERVYCAQIKLFGIWIDCKYIPFYYSLERCNFGLPESSSRRNVENFIEAKLNKSAKQIDWETHVEKEF